MIRVPFYPYYVAVETRGGVWFDLRQLWYKLRYGW
jgi:hypothetical protein